MTTKGRKKTKATRLLEELALQNAMERAGLA